MKTSVSTIVLILGIATASGQQYPFRNYFIKDGLTRNEIRVIHQDSGGWIWIGTADGADRYDGASFTHFTRSNGLSSDFINDITEDNKGTIWIATNFGGLISYSQGEFRSYLIDPENPSSPANSVNNICNNENGSLWVAADRGIYYFTGGKFTVIDDQVTGRAIININDNILVGTQSGLKKVIRSQNKFSLADVSGYNMEITTLAFGPDSILWIGTMQGLFYYSPWSAELNRWQGDRLINYLQGKHIRCLMIEENNTIWIGLANEGVLKVTTNGMFTSINESNGLAGNIVVDITRDREGNIWFATTTGLSKLSTEQIINFTRSDGLPDHNVNAIIRDDAGGMWFGTKVGITRMSENQFITFTMKDGLPDNYILCLLMDRDGNLWYGSEAGPGRIYPYNNKPRIISYKSGSGWNDGAARNRAYSIYQDEEENLWFGNDKGISLFRQERFIAQSTEGFSEEKLVTCIVRDNSGNLWAGLYKGGILIYEVHQEKSGEPYLVYKRRIGTADGLNDENIRCAFKSKNGSLWFGTRFGGAVNIILKDETIKSIKNYTTNEGIAGNWINEIIEDQHGNIWLATSRGVCRLSFNGNREEAYISKRLTFHDGLAGDGVITIFEDVYGHIWIGTYNGVTYYDPSMDVSLPVPPPVYITNFMVSGYTDTAALRKNHADLDYQHHSIAIEYIGISFNDESEVKYRYMLEGFDSTWSQITDHRYVNYTHLPAGDYIFSVQAVNGSGIWSTEPATFSFKVYPPLWARWWFILLSVLCISALALFVHRYRLKQAVAVEKLRLRIAADLHDDVGSTLSSIAITSNLAQKNYHDITKTNEALNRIGENARRLMEQLDDIVWTINPGNDLLDDLLIKMKEFSTEILEGKGINYRINLPENNSFIKIPMEDRRHLYLIFKEVVNNMVRHSSCANVYISAELDSKVLNFKIDDDGTGFNAASLPNGNGLNNIKKRAEIIGAEFRIKTSTGKGTSVFISYPLT